MAMLYRPLAFYRETCVFPSAALEKPLKILKPFLAQVITLVRPTNPPNLVDIGSRGAPLHSGEISHFCDICSPFFYIYIFFFTFPYLAYRSQFSTDLHARWLKRRVLFRTRAFWGFRAFKFTFRGSPAQKIPKFRPVCRLSRFAAEISLALEPSRVNYP